MLIQQLKSLDFDPRHLVEFLTAMIERYRQDTGIAANFVCDVGSMLPPPRVSLAAFRKSPDPCCNSRCSQPFGFVLPKARIKLMKLKNFLALFRNTASCRRLLIPARPSLTRPLGGSSCRLIIASYSNSLSRSSGFSWPRVCRWRHPFHLQSSMGDFSLCASWAFTRSRLSEPEPT
jgi:hypothetical protein